MTKLIPYLTICLRELPVFIDDFHKIVDLHGRLELEVANLLTEDLQQGKSLSHLNYFVDSFKTLRNYHPASFFSKFS